MIRRQRGRFIARAVRWQSVVWAAILGFLPVVQPTTVAQTQTSSPPSLATQVPDDVGIWLEFDRLSPRLDQLLRGRLGQRLETFPPLARWREKNERELNDLASLLTRELGASPEELSEKIFGGRVALAVWPPRDPASDSPAAILIEATDDRLLARLSEKLHERRESLRLSIESREWRIAGQPVAYRRIVGEGEKDALYLGLAGQVAAIANDESLLRRLMESRSAGQGSSRLADLPAYRSALGRISANAAAKLFINPRPWDRLLERAPGNGALADRGPLEDPLRQGFLRAWGAARYAILALELDEDVALMGHVAWEWASLPDFLAAVTDCLVGSNGFLARVPPDALLVVTGRLDIGKFASALRALTGTTDTSVGAEWAQSIANCLGPDMGLFVAPAVANQDRENSGGEPASPFYWAAGLDTRPSPLSPTGSPLAAGVDGLLQSGLAFAVSLANRQAGEDVAAVESDRIDGVDVTSLRGLGPNKRWGRLSCLVSGAYLWLGDSAESLPKIAALAGKGSLAERLATRFPRAGRLPNPTHSLYVDLAGVRDVLARSREWAESFAKQGHESTQSAGVSQDVADRNWADLMALLGLVDWLAIEAEFATDGVSLRAQFAARP